MSLAFFVAANLLPIRPAIATSDPAPCRKALARAQALKAQIQAAPQDYSDVPRTLAVLDDTIAKAKACLAREPAPPGPSPETASLWPPVPPLDAYTAPDARKPPLPVRTWYAAKTILGFHLHAMTEDEKRRLRAVEDELTSTPTGAALVRQLGGWKGIGRDTVITVDPVGGTGTLAVHRVLFGWERKRLGKSFAVQLSPRLMADGAGAAAPVLGHELSHLRDAREEGAGNDMQITSERLAHRMQVYIFREVRAALPTRRRAALRREADWQYQRFISDLWEDRLEKRFRSATAFADTYPGAVLRAMSLAAYADVSDHAVADGTAQLDRHVEDVYRKLTDERDAAAGIGPEAQANAEALRARMLRRGDAFDRDYRSSHGEVLP